MPPRAVSGLLAAQLASTLGSQLTALAVPWFVLVETGSASRMALVLAAHLLPVALLGFPSGALVQRLGARTTMIAADLGSAPLIALVPLLHALDALTFGVLLGIAAALGVFATPYYASQRLVLPEVVGEDERLVARANTLLEGTTEVTNLVGPALAGVLIALVGAHNVLWLDAASYVVSAIALVVFVPGAARRPGGEPSSRGVFAGIRALLRDRLLRAVTFATLVFGFAGPMLFAAIPFLTFVRFGEDAKIAGFLLASWGAGAIAGSALTFWLVERLRPLRVASIGVVGFVAPLWFLALELPAWGVAVVLAFSGLANPLTNTVLAVITVGVSPAVRAKAMTALLTANQLVAPAGYVLAGLLLEEVGLAPVFLLVACVDTIAAAVFLSAALRA